MNGSNRSQGSNREQRPRWGLPVDARALMFALALCSAVTRAQVKTSDPAINQLIHPEGTQTSPLGELGRVDKSGTGPIPMILIPGAAFGGSVWKDFMERNKDVYTMYAITPAGYEGTKPPPISPGDNYEDQQWTDAMVKAIAQLMERERLDRPVIIGHHLLGDYTALRLATEHATKVGGVVIVSGSPFFPMAAWGSNKPGTPTKLTDEKQRIEIVRKNWLPFYEHVTPQMWQAGSFQARRLCIDAPRAQQLFEQQIAVPIPTQIRYFLEYLSADLRPQLQSIDVPLLVILPDTAWTEDSAYAAYKESNEMMSGGDAHKARANWKSFMTQSWGDLETAIKWNFDQAYQWEQVRSSVPNLEIKRVRDARIFIMDDQPSDFDRHIRMYVAGLKR
jgi:pimeloyl-ACP methyl ester carboxylesterase